MFVCIKRERWRSIILLLIILIVSAMLRLWHLEDYPRWYCDEGTNAHLGLNLMEGTVGYRTWGPNFFPPLFDLIQGITIRILGRSYLAIRLPAAIFGLFSIVLLWHILRRFSINEYFAFLAVMLYSLGSMHINRMGLQYNAAVFFMLLTILFAMSSSSTKRHFLAGLSAGLAFLSHYAGGAISFIFLFILFLSNRNLKMLFNALVGALISLTPFILLVFFTAPQWFIYDLLYQGKRPFDLHKLLVNLFIATPFGWEFLYPLGQAPQIIYGFTLLGAISLIYILITSNQRPLELIAFVLSPILGALVAKDIWWSFLSYLYPSYALAVAIVCHEAYKSGSVVKVAIFLIPAIIQLLTMLNIFSNGIYYILIFLSMLPLLNVFTKINFKEEYSKALIRIARAMLLIGILLYVVILPLLLDIPLLFINANEDKKAVINLVNSFTRKGDLVALPSEFLPLIKDGVEGVDIAQLAFIFAKKPQFLYEDVDIYLKRFKPWYQDLMNYSLIIFAFDYGLPIKELTGGMLIDYLMFRWPSIVYGRHIIFINPFRAMNISFNGKFIVPLNATSYGYSLGVESWCYNITKDILILKAKPKATYGWAFWKIKFLKPVVVKGDLLIIAKVNASTDLIRFVIKPIDIKDNEILPWVVLENPKQNNYVTKYYIVNDTLMLGGIVIGFDWNTPELLQLINKGENIVVTIKYVIIITNISQQLKNG